VSSVRLTRLPSMTPRVDVVQQERQRMVRACGELTSAKVRQAFEYININTHTIHAHPHV